MGVPRKQRDTNGDLVVSKGGMGCGRAVGVVAAGAVTRAVGVTSHDGDFLGVAWDLGSLNRPLFLPFVSCSLGTFQQRHGKREIRPRRVQSDLLLGRRKGRNG